MSNENVKRDLTHEQAQEFKWSHESKPIPVPGRYVKVKWGDMGIGKVVGYFAEKGESGWWSGCVIELSIAPVWHRQQFPAGHIQHNKAYLFGKDIDY